MSLKPRDLSPLHKSDNDPLSGLRHQLEAGLITRDHAIWAMARIYLDARLPLRAAALAAALPPGYRPDPAVPDAAAIHERALKGLFRHPPRLALNMIVKNEEDNLAEALASVDTAVDEIVIVDPGSTDRTRDIAQLFGITLIEQPWEDDFSRPRNEAIAHTRAPRIFWMDADDRLPAESASRLKTLSTRPADDCMLCRVVNCENGRPGSDFLQARLFPNRADIRWERRIHEQIMLSVKRAGVPFSCCRDLAILHTGYHTPEENRKKARRNRPLLYKEIPEEPDLPSLHLNLGDACMILGEYDEAIEAYNRIFAIPGAWEMNPDLYTQAFFYLGLAWKQKENHLMARRYAYRTLYHDQSRIEAAYLLGLLYRETGEMEQAVYWFSYALKTTPPIRITSTDNLHTKAESAWALARITLDSNDYAGAAQLLEPFVTHVPNAPLLHQLLGEAYLGLNNLTGAARCFTTAHRWLPDNPAPLRGIAQVYEKAGDPVSALSFNQQAETIEKSKEESALVDSIPG